MSFTTTSAAAVASSTGTTATTASFTPAVGETLLVLATGGAGSSVALTLAITDSQAGTWTSRIVSNLTAPGGGGGAVTAIFSRTVASATAMTVTATTSGTGVNATGLQVYRLNPSSGATITFGTPTRGSVGASLSITPSALTSTVAGSVMFVSTSEWSGGATLSSSDLTLTSFTNGSMEGGFGFKTLGAAGAQTFQQTVSSGGGQWYWAAIEIWTPGVSFTGTQTETTTASGSLTTGMSGTRTETTTASGGLLLGAGFTASQLLTTTQAGSLTTISRVMVGFLEIELVAGSNVWTDFTSRLDMASKALEIRHGRPTVYDDVGPAQLTTSLFNDDGAIMPDNPSAATPLVEGMRIRWRVSKSGTTYTRFVGWITDLVPDFPGESTFGARIAVTAGDALSLIAQRKLRSNWTEAALALGRAGSVTADAYEAAGTVIGVSASLTNYSTDPGAAPVGGYAYGNSPNLSFASDRDTSIGPVVNGAVDNKASVNKTIPVIQTGSKCVQWLIKTPTEVPASGQFIVSSPHPPSSLTGIQIAAQADGSGGVRLVVMDVNATTTTGTLLSAMPRGQWVLISCVERASSTSQQDVTATVLATGASGTVSAVPFDVKTYAGVEWPNSTGNASSGSFGGVVAFGQRTGLGYAEASIVGPQGTIAQRLPDVQAALSRLPITWATVGSLSTQVVTGVWSDRTGLEVLQELVRSGLAIAWGRSRDSVVHVIDAASLRPATVLATIDTDADCAGTPRLARSTSTRPTRVQVDTPGTSTLIIDTAAEAGPGSPQRLKTVTTVCASGTDMSALGLQMLAARARLRITQLVVDLTAGATDHTAELFSEAGTLSGLFPTARVRAIVPVSHFGVPTRDYWAQGWVESYHPQGVRVTLDTDPCVTSTMLAETFTGANGSGWSASWSATFGLGVTGATFDVQGNRGRIVSGVGGQAGKRTAAVSPDVEITGSVIVTGTAEGQVWWRMDTAGTNGYGLVFSAAGGVRLQQAVAGTVSTRYNAAQVGGPAVVAGTEYSWRIRHQGDRLSVKAWATAGTEPAAWGLNGTDALFTAAGCIGLAQWVASGTCTFDNVTVTDGA